ncbi:hypothetical protein [Clostridium felsineum]|nr:hypothetical protein [Clostridium felsineum]URZ01847.1 hypothetical protein CLAUR_018440 [Clostridium felsineum]
MAYLISKVKIDKSPNYCCAVTKNGIVRFNGRSLSIFNDFANICIFP